MGPLLAHLVRLLAIATCASGSLSQAQPVHLELRIIAQSGIPTAAPALPNGCVFDHPPGPVSITPGILQRFEVQARLVDTSSADGLVPDGLLATTFRIVSTRSGVWQRSLLSAQEVNSAIDPPASGAGVDCSGATTYRGLHGAFRAWDYGGGAPRNEDPQNGTIGSSAITGIRAEALTTGAGSRWAALYSFDFTLPTTLTGDVGLNVRLEPINDVAFVWTTRSGQVLDGDSWSGVGLLLRSPSSPFACCARGNCYIALTPSACFANDGDPAVGGVCTPSACCPADLNDDGTASIQDVFDFLDAYLSGDPAADTDHNGVLTINDLFTFLESWYGGCPP